MLYARVASREGIQPHAEQNIALGSGEAEFYGLVSTASKALGLVAMSEDFGDKIDAYLYSDASAAV